MQSNHKNSGEIKQEKNKDKFLKQIIAITIFENRISSRLDYAENILLLTVKNGKIIKKEQLIFNQVDPIRKINRLIELGVNVLICGGLTNICKEKLERSQINVIPWLSGNSTKILERYLAGKLN